MNAFKQNIIDMYMEVIMKNFIEKSYKVSKLYSLTASRFR